MRQNCRKWVAGGLILANSLLWGAIAVPTFPAVAQERSAREICMDAISAAQNQMHEGRTINLQTRLLNLSESSGYPGDRSQGLNFLLSNFSRYPGLTPDGQAIMMSPVFMKSVATEIINHCPSFSYINFDGGGMGWDMPFGLIDGIVEGFRCLPPEQSDPRRDPPASWGFHNCSI